MKRRNTSGVRIRPLAARSFAIWSVPSPSSMWNATFCEVADIGVLTWLVYQS